jgi:hypothetical protein
MDDLMNNRDKQIMAISIVFFVLAFPTYFFLTAANADSSASLTAVTLYEIDGEYTYIELDAGDEFIPNGDPLMIDDLHTDAIDDAEDLNIIGVRMTMSYIENEGSSAFPPGGCNGITGGSVQADTITGMTMHGDYNKTASGSNNGDSGSHTVESYWVNTSLIAEEIVLMSKGEIISEIDSDGAGLGAYSAEISVDAQASSTATCERTDDGEDVTYTIELIVFDYDIKPFFEVIEEL